MKIIIVALPIFTLACDALGPRSEDVHVDAPPRPPTTQPDALPPATSVLPPGSIVPSISENIELTNQIRVNDGLSDSALAMTMGVLTRTAGKADNGTVMFWSFGSVPMSGNFVVSSPLYVLAESDGAGGYVPLASHPALLDSIPGDPRYSAVRRIVYVPIMPQYAGEILASIEALAEALDTGLVGEPIPAGTWQNVPVVPIDTRLELGGTAEPLAATEMFARGYRVATFPLGGARGIQPLRNGGVPLGQEARLLSGVAAGTPPTLPIAADPQPVFQYGIPAAPPTMAFNYTPFVTQVDVRLATGVAPTAVGSDAQLFKRSTSGSISAYFVDTVASFTITTTITNRQIQFEEGMP